MYRGDPSTSCCLMRLPVMWLTYVSQVWESASECHFPSGVCNSGFSCLQKVSFTQVVHIVQYLALIFSWLGHTYLVFRCGCLSPFWALGQILCPVESVMSAKVITCRYILHLFSCLSSLVLLYFRANSSIMYTSFVRWICGIHSFVTCICPLHCNSAWRTDVSHVVVSHWCVRSSWIRFNIELDVPASNWRYSRDWRARSPPLSPFLMLQINSWICL